MMITYFMVVIEKERDRQIEFWVNRGYNPDYVNSFAKECICIKNNFDFQTKFLIKICQKTIGRIYFFFFNLLKTGIREIIAIFWTINDPPGLQGLMKSSTVNCCEGHTHTNFSLHLRTVTL